MSKSGSKAEAAGIRLGRACRALAAHQTRATQWLIAKGVSPASATSITWFVTSVLILVLVYLAPIVLFCLLLIAAVIGFARNTDEEVQQDWFPKPTDHRDELFYDPLSHNDDPDPRFEDK